MIRKSTFSTIFAVLAVITTALSGCGPAAAAVPTQSAADPMKGNIAISGAFALYPIVTRWTEEFQKIHPGVTFDVSAGGAGKGMTDALSGAVDIGMVSRTVKPEETSQGAYDVGVTKDAVFGVVNAKNPVVSDILAKGISKDTLIKIYITGEIKTWGEVVGKPEITDEIHVYTRSDAAGAAEMWAKFLGNKLQEDLLGLGVNADPGVLEAVAKDPFGIGYNNLGYAFDLKSGSPVAGIAIVPLDVNSDGQADDTEQLTTMKAAVDAVAAGTYPSPPARVLNLVTRGKPTGLVQAFLQWILTDGQAFVGEAGYVTLTPDQLAKSLEKVK